MNANLVVVRYLIGPQPNTAHIITGLPQHPDSDNRSVSLPPPMHFVELTRTRRVDPLPLLKSLIMAQLTCSDEHWQFHHSHNGGFWRRITFVHEKHGQPFGKRAYDIQDHLSHLTAGGVYVHFDRTGGEFGRPHFSVVLTGFSRRPAEKHLIFEPERDPNHPFIVIPAMAVASR